MTTQQLFRHLGVQAARPVTASIQAVLQIGAVQSGNTASAPAATWNHTEIVETVRQAWWYTGFKAGINEMRSRLQAQESENGDAGCVPPEHDMSNWLPKGGLC